MVLREREKEEVGTDLSPETCESMLVDRVLSVVRNNCFAKLLFWFYLE